VTKQGTRTYARQTLIRTNPASALTRAANTCLNVPSITPTNTKFCSGWWKKAATVISLFDSIDPSLGKFNAHRDYKMIEQKNSTRERKMLMTA